MCAFVFVHYRLGPAVHLGNKACTGFPLLTVCATQWGQQGSLPQTPIVGGTTNVLQGPPNS